MDRIAGTMVVPFVTALPRRRSQVVSNVRAHIPLCREHFRLILGLSDFPPTEPGQFVQVACRDLNSVTELRDFDWSDGGPPGLDGAPLLHEAMLRRPFSLAGRRDTSGGVELEIIYRVVGVGTDWLSHLTPGDRVHVLGPLGNAFTMPAPGQRAILVGGGVGIPPMLYLAERLGNAAIAFAGAVTRDLLPFTLQGEPRAMRATSVTLEQALVPAPRVEEFARHGVNAVITTDDGSYGFQGFVTQALERYLDSTSATSPAPLLYTCGPEPMMKRVAMIAAARGLECQVAVERAMACGMGTCQSCCIKVRKPDASQPPLAGSDWCYRLACTDGPVFRGQDLLW